MRWREVSRHRCRSPSRYAACYCAEMLSAATLCKNAPLARPHLTVFCVLCLQESGIDLKLLTKELSNVDAIMEVRTARAWGSLRFGTFGKRQWLQSSCLRKGCLSRKKSQSVQLTNCFSKHPVPPPPPTHSKSDETWDFEHLFTEVKSSLQIAQEEEVRILPDGCHIPCLAHWLIECTIRCIMHTQKGCACLRLLCRALTCNMVVFCPPGRRCSKHKPRALN